jgi:hypothetical protein
MASKLEAHPRELVCRCGRKHCSPSCEACRIIGMSRVHPRPDYNRNGS